VNGEVIGIPVTGETKAKWVEVPTPPPRKAPNPIVELAQAFRGVVLEVAIPPGASPQAAQAYRVDGTVTLAQLIQALRANLPANEQSAASASATSSEMSEVRITFSNAVAVVSRSGQLLELNAPLTITLAPALAQGGQSTASGTIIVKSAPTGPLQLQAPPPNEVTTESAVANSFGLGSGNTGTGNTGTGNTGTGNTGTGNTGTGNTGTGNTG
jgi:hypothetical protein